MSVKRVLAEIGVLGTLGLMTLAVFAVITPPKVFLAWSFAGRSLAVLGLLSVGLIVFVCYTLLLEFIDEEKKK